MGGQDANVFDNANYNDYEDNLYNDNNNIDVENDESNDVNKMNTIMIIKMTKMMTLRGRAQYPTPGHTYFEAVT